MAPESGAAAQLTIGEQVTENLYVKVQQGIGDVSTTNFILEYELTKWLRFQTILLQGDLPTARSGLYPKPAGPWAPG